MKQTFLVLVVFLIASPALGRVDFDCTNELDEVTITWTIVGDTNLVRAFALDIISDANIDKNSFTGLDPNYWVYPGSIDINATTGQVDANGNTVCTGPPDGTELDPNSATVEMGSLYKGDANKPLPSGVVLKFQVETDGPFEITLRENAIRAGVVMEDANNDDANLPQTWNFVQDCFPNEPDHTQQYADWVEMGKPDCWCPSGTTVPDSNGFQCVGDADNGTEDFFGNYRVAYNDLNVVLNNWKLDMAAVIAAGYVAKCADTNHKWEDFFMHYRVAYDDMNRILNNWKQTDAQLTATYGANPCPLTDAVNDVTP